MTVLHLGGSAWTTSRAPLPTCQGGRGAPAYLIAWRNTRFLFPPRYRQSIALLHDAHKAYLGDITTPAASLIQNKTVALANPPPVKAARNYLDNVIFPAFGLRYPLGLDARLIRELRPRYALVENSPRLLHKNIIGHILRDLHEIGYDTEWQVIPACAFNLPQIRERIFILAYPHSNGFQMPTILRIGEACDPRGGVKSLRHHRRKSKIGSASFMEAYNAAKAKYPIIMMLIASLWQRPAR